MDPVPTQLPHSRLTRPVVCARTHGTDAKHAPPIVALETTAVAAEEQVAAVVSRVRMPHRV